MKINEILVICLLTLYGILFSNNLKSQTDSVIAEIFECKNPINKEELEFICQNLEFKFRNRNYNIQTHDLLMLFTYYNSGSENGISCFNLNDDVIFEKRTSRKVIDSLFGQNQGLTQGLGYIYYDYNFVKGGKGDDCCCLTEYDYYSQQTDSIFNNGLPISKFIFDYLCNEILIKINSLHLSLTDAKILTRLANTIKLNNLNDSVHVRLLNEVKLIKYQTELDEIYRSYKTWYQEKDGLGIKLYDYGDKANYYNIIDFPEPQIKYKFN